MRIYISSCIEVSVPFLLWKHEKSFLHEAAGALLQAEGEGAEDPGHVHRLGMHDSVLQPCGQTGCATCSGGSAQAELVKCFAVDLRDSTFLLKLTESSLVQLVVL